MWKGELLRPRQSRYKVLDPHLMALVDLGKDIKEHHVHHVGNADIGKR